MFRHAFVLLVTTVLASLAVRDYARGRNNGYNSLYGDYEGLQDNDVDIVKGDRYPSQSQFGRTIVRSERKKRFGHGDVSSSKYSDIDDDSEGSSGIGYEIRDRDSDICDDADSTATSRKLPVYIEVNPQEDKRSRDPIWRDIRRIRGFPLSFIKPMFTKTLGNANNNLLEMRYRRQSPWSSYSPRTRNWNDVVKEYYENRDKNQDYLYVDRASLQPEVGNVEPRYNAPEVPFSEHPTKIPPFWFRQGQNNQDYNEFEQPDSRQNVNFNSNTNYFGSPEYNERPSRAIAYPRFPRRQKATTDSTVDKNGYQ